MACVVAQQVRTLPTACSNHGLRRIMASAVAQQVPVVFARSGRDFSEVVAMCDHGTTDLGEPFVAFVVSNLKYRKVLEALFFPARNKGAAWGWINFGQFWILSTGCVRRICTRNQQAAAAIGFQNRDARKELPPPCHGRRWTLGLGVSLYLPVVFTALADFRPCGTGCFYNPWPFQIQLPVAIVETSDVSSTHTIAVTITTDTTKSYDNSISR